MICSAVNNQNKLYYGTSHIRWDHIKKKGLLPNLCNDIYIILIPEMKSDSVYLTETSEGAMFYAQSQAKKDTNDPKFIGPANPVILQVQIPDHRKLRISNNGEIKGFRYKGRIPPKFINKINTA